MITRTIYEAPVSFSHRNSDKELGGILNVRLDKIGLVTIIQQLDEIYTLNSIKQLL